MTSNIPIHRRDELSAEHLIELLAGEPREAARAILAAAETGLIDAQVMLGQILLSGQGIRRDPKLAFIWFEIAAQQGHPMGWNMLGRCLEHGWGCIADLAQAADAYAQAAAGGLDWGMYNQANLLATGRGVARDPAAAFRLYLQAADRGHAKSMNLVGRCYEEGQGTAANPHAAFEWYRRSAEAGDFRGQFSHAAILMARGEIDAARHWLLQALQGGNLKFLSVASAQLQNADLPALADITQAYLQRYVALQASDTEARAIGAATPVGLPLDEHRPPT